jgi:anti-sigma-K factor RskA
MNHDEAFDLLAPMALDALDAHVRAEVERHVESCPQCQVELDGLREVASALGNTFEPLPEGLWTKIAGRLYERPGTEDTVVPALELSGLVTPLTRGQSRRQALTKRAKATLATVTLVAAAAIVALAVSLAGANAHVANLQRALKNGDQSAVASALAAPGHKIVTLRSSAKQELATFVMLPDGRGYLVSSSLPALSSKDTYQLWGIVNGSPVSVGVMGGAPHHVAFTLASSPAPSALAVTIEPAGGSLTPATTLVGSGALEAS